MCFGDNVLVADVPATLRGDTFVAPKDRPVGAKATFAELGGTVDGDNASLDGSGYSALTGLSKFLFEIQHRSEIEASGARPGGWIIFSDNDLNERGFSEVWYSNPTDEQVREDDYFDTTEVEYIRVI